jgi:SagB-type dehydrogenase family enzyme
MMNSYHDSTKHSYQSIRENASYMDWNHQPSRYKIYPKKFPHLLLDLQQRMHKFLYLIGGISAKKSYATETYFLRMNPSAGALYPNEIYFQVRDVEGFEDGIYHFEVKNSLVRLLKPLDEDGIEKDLGLQKPIKGFIFLLSACYVRSAWKYKTRAFRYLLLDGGHLLGGIEASAYLQDFAARVIYDFDKVSLAKKFGFNTQEFFLSATIVGIPLRDEKIFNAVEMALPFVDATGYFQADTMIEKAYHDSLKIVTKKGNNRPSHFIYRKDVFEETIVQRRSIREMHQKSISKEHLSFILQMVNQPVMSDVDERIELYLFVHRVTGMERGLYHDSCLVKEGDFSQQAGYLALEQYHLGENAAFTVFLVSKSPNYQAMYQKAGLLGHRFYLAANYMQIGCSGIGAYYDDEVAEFLDLDSEYMVLYGICIGN